MSYRTIREISTALAEKTYSSVEITQEYLTQIGQQNPELNGYITVCHEQALAQAHAADARSAKGEANLLTGVPMAQKDIFCTRQVPTTCASRMLENYVSPFDAHVIQNCEQAGLVMLGKTNMDEFAMGSSNETSYFGPVKNPWDETVIPGGSSGGSAAVVAAGLAPAATGTDTGGSIRQPAALCGITGIKPTYGLVSRYGMIAFASSLDQGGIMAHTAEDCALLLAVMAGHDKRDSTSVDRPVPQYADHLTGDLKGLKIGVPLAFFAEGLDADVGQQIEAALQTYQSLGAELIDIELPHNEAALAAYYVIAPAEASSNLSRFDGVRFGHRCENPQDLKDLYCRTREEGFGTEVKRRIMMGTYALSSGYYDAYYLKAQQIRRMIAEDFKRAFEQVDVIMGPTTPTPAFKVGQNIDDPISMYLSDVYTLSVNLVGLPAMSIPAGFTNGLPVGLQLIGNLFEETRLLNIAHQFQQHTDFHRQHPQ